MKKLPLRFLVNISPLTLHYTPSFLIPMPWVHYVLRTLWEATEEIMGGLAEIHESSLDMGEAQEVD